MDNEMEVQDQELEQNSVQDTQPDEELDLDLEDEQGEGESMAEESPEALKKRIADLEAKNKQLYARVKKTKSEPKQEQKPTINQPKGDYLTRQELQEELLRDKGMSDDDISMLKKIVSVNRASGKNISLMDAQRDELFQIHQEKKAREQRSQRAQLGASGGSSVSTPGVKPGMSKTEHMEVWRKKSGLA